MRATLTDSQAFEALSPVELVSYLRAHGWRRDAEIAGGLAQSWVWPLDGGRIDVIVPVDHTVRDFRRRVAETLQTLEALENRSQLDILADIQQISSDVIRWRWIEEGAEDGTISLEQGQHFIWQVRIQLLAAACSAVQPRQFFASRKAAQATEYLRQARLGQSERGSYVVTVHSPEPPVISFDGPLAGNADDIEPADDPFERRVTRTLAGALRSLHHVASGAVGNGRVESEGLARNGISANLCESVSSMLGTGKVRRDVEIHFSFSGSLPVSGDAPPLTRFSSDLSAVIGEIGKGLRETATREDFELTGFVTDLSRGPQDEKGIAIIQGLVDDAYHRVEIRNAAEEYETVLTVAHRDRRMVRCEGELRKVKGKTYRLLNPRGFQLLPLE
jgi:hypothetical protein